MSAREHVLGLIRRRLDRPAEDTARADARLAARPAGPLPGAAQGDAGVLRQRFIERARAASAEVESLGGVAELPALAARLCADAGYPREVALAPDDTLPALDWAQAGLGAQARAAEPGDRVCVGSARCGVAETGTLVMASGPDAPVTLSFLPELHLVLLRATTIVGSYEQAWAELRARGALPRTVNWITGPSRSADIEQTLQLGAHGPVRLVIALVDDGPDRDPQRA